MVRPGVGAQAADRPGPEAGAARDATGLVDHAVVLTFDETRRRESAEDFVTEVLDGCLHARLVVVGADFHFGNGRRGNVALLERMGRDLGFEVVGLDLVAPTPAPAVGTRTS